MASEESKARDRKLAEEALFKARGAESAQAETDMFKCGKCRGRRCTYFQMQTRSADEPMTTFVTCVNCGNHWKVCRKRHMSLFVLIRIHVSSHHLSFVKLIFMASSKLAAIIL